MDYVIADVGNGGYYSGVFGSDETLGADLMLGNINSFGDNIGDVAKPREQMENPAQVVAQAVKPALVKKEEPKPVFALPKMTETQRNAVGAVGSVLVVTLGLFVLGSLFPHKRSPSVVRKGGKHYMKDW